MAHPIIPQLLFESIICNPVECKSYWSIDKWVRFGPQYFLSSYSTVKHSVTISIDVKGLYVATLQLMEQSATHYKLVV